MKLRWLPRPDGGGHSLQADGVIIGWVTKCQYGRAWNVRVIGIPKHLAEHKLLARDKKSAAEIIVAAWKAKKI